MDMPIHVIVALDFDNQADALLLVDQLDPALCALKVGSEMFTLFGPDFVRALISRQFKVFLDLKFYDIPNTVAGACRAVADLGVWMLTMHASGGHAMMKAAYDALQSYGAARPLLVAVTVLTSTNEAALKTTGIDAPLQEHVCMLARCAQRAGLDGVVSSAIDVPLIKTTCGSDFLSITPGIRRLHDNTNDQARIVTPEMAYNAGSDFLVVGRPITGAQNPVRVLQDFLKKAM